MVVSASTSATLGSGSASRDLKVYGATSSLTIGSAARDLFVVTSATAGDAVEITATSDILASAATLKSTGVGAADDAHVLAKSTNGAVNVGSGVTEGAGVAAGDVTFDAGDTITAGSTLATRDVKAVAAGDIDLASATSARDISVTSNGGQAILRKAVLTGSGTGHDLSITASGNAVLGDPDYAAITTANLFSPTGGNTGTASVKSTGGDAVVNIDSASNGIALVASAIAGNVTGLQKTGDLVIDELAAYNITLEAMGGTLDVSAISSGGDYTVTAQGFVGDALAPYPYFGDLLDVTITDTLGDLDLGTLSLHAGHKLTITAQNGAVTGLGQLDAGTGIGDGEVEVTAAGITLDTVQSDASDIYIEANSGQLGALDAASARLGRSNVGGMSVASATGANLIDVFLPTARPSWGRRSSLELAPTA
ncbi:hypothetical protein [Caulobacter hibisci]|uniref:Uncharacterized protein n=1 Tax=Caulobacter hibisci TaxID=2035993 RepID=A0ABS0T4C6_9CAUL|nr:hypothetical protein [Caulobacter hibisci]MBI1686741.1 hypothetical protein [Caulobacter hibisci]